ncbi:hypothetical protein BGX38DRAFT_831819 [Terfezia claveryi]|nr:hypothetical protein BGX38DRAFT_831819 [Terfezia claveryi]
MLMLLLSHGCSASSSDYSMRFSWFVYCSCMQCPRPPIFLPSGKAWRWRLYLGMPTSDSDSKCFFYSLPSFPPALPSPSSPTSLSLAPRSLLFCCRHSFNAASTSPPPALAPQHCTPSLVHLSLPTLPRQQGTEEYDTFFRRIVRDPLLFFWRKRVAPVLFRHH